MKFLFFSPMVWDNYRSRNVELPLGLAETGHECIYVNPVKYRDSGNVLRLRNISAHSSYSVKVIERLSKLPKSFLLVIYENYDNVRMIRKNKPDLVVSWDYLMSLFICVYCKIKHIPFVFDVMDDWEEVEKNSFVRYYFKCIAKPVLNRLSAIITSTSHRQAEEYQNHNKRVYVIPNGKSLEFIKKASQYVTTNPLKYESKTVNFISTLRDWYDFDLLFEVFKQFPELQLNIYGQGDLFEYLKNKSTDYSNIAIKGNAESDILPGLVSESLFGILPLKLNKLNESTCPIKLFDYWSAKKAIIASPTYELKKMGENGGLILASTKDEYVNAIKLLLADTSLRQSVGEKGYQNMIAKYNYDIIIKQFVNSLALGK
jgi:glycosyltransferase involved in cell wall biosynthesis